MITKHDLTEPYNKATKIEITGVEFGHGTNGLIKFNLLNPDGSILQAGCEVVPSVPVEGLSLEAIAAQAEEGLEAKRGK